MMLRPAMSQIIRKEQSYYKFVVAVAKRAREIADFSDENGIALEEKSVKISVDEFASGKIRMID